MELLVLEDMDTMAREDTVQFSGEFCQLDAFVPAEVTEISRGEFGQVGGVGFERAMVPDDDLNNRARECCTSGRDSNIQGFVPRHPSQ